MKKMDSELTGFNPFIPIYRIITLPFHFGNAIYRNFNFIFTLIIIVLLLIVVGKAVSVVSAII